MRMFFFIYLFLFKAMPTRRKFLLIVYVLILKQYVAFCWRFPVQIIFVAPYMTLIEDFLFFYFFFIIKRDAMSVSDGMCVESNLWDLLDVFLTT